MKTTLRSCFLRLTMLVGLLMVSTAIAQKQDQGAAVMQPALQRQMAERGQCDVQPRFAFYVSFGSAKASLDVGERRQGLGNAGSSEQVAATQRLAVAGLAGGRGSGSAMMVALIPGAEESVHVLGPLLSVAPAIFGDLVDPAIPSWLYCKLHPRWCKNL